MKVIKAALFVFLGFAPLNSFAFTTRFFNHDASGFGISYSKPIEESEVGKLSLGLEFNGRTLRDINKEDQGRVQLQGFFGITHQVSGNFFKVYDIGLGGDFGNAGNYAVVLHRVGLMTKDTGSNWNLASTIGVEILFSIHPPKDLKSRTEAISVGPYWSQSF